MHSQLTAKLVTLAEKTALNILFLNITSVMLKEKLGRVNELLLQGDCWSVNFDRQSLYDNEQNIQEYFALFWRQVAQQFNQNPYVLGEFK